MKKIIKLPKKKIIKKDISNNAIKKFTSSNDCSKFLNMLYLNQSFKNDIIIKKQLKSKLNGYKSQDKKKKRYNPEKYITYDELIEKLVISKMICYYCREKCCLVSEKKRDMTQWTLDRINNDIGHYNENVVISCLNCNLQKRRRSDEHFKFAKQMKIIKHF